MIPITLPFGIMQEKARRGELTREQYRQLIEALKLLRQVEALAFDGGIPIEDAKPVGSQESIRAGNGRSGGFR